MARQIKNLKQPAPSQDRTTGERSPRGGVEIGARRPEQDGRQRVVIERAKPEIDGGRFPIKRVVGDTVVVEADLFADGHDAISGVLLYRQESSREWQETGFQFVNNDRWRASFPVNRLGTYQYTIQAWIDRFGSWQRDMKKRVGAGQIASIDLLVGARLLEERTSCAQGADADRLRRAAEQLRKDQRPSAEQLEAVLGEEIGRLMTRYADRRFATTYQRELSVTVDRERARFSAWYELFPRSSAPEPGRHGTFKDCEARLPYIAGMGFDVLYLPPIHPIGRMFRKGKNNDPNGGPDVVGSPWAIGSHEGGHKAVHPGLGTIEDFRGLVRKAGEYGLEVALDLAFQCSPDHPYVKDHPEWFKKRPDGTIQYAENPPKKYQDIYPIDFETEQWETLWAELKSVVIYWVEQGVRIFRVDNPHTKAFPFWEWLIGEIKRDYSDVLFLSEAFTRPKVMYRLAKLGFTQSYTYFAWRTSKAELTEYLTELTRTEVGEYFRPNLWPNTPDILTEQLQHGGRATFMSRLVLAATLGASYGIYGPAYELCEHRAIRAGSEEYLDSEKYEIRHWPIDRPDSLREFIGLVNRARRSNPALQRDDSLRFHQVDNEYLIAYSKRTEDWSNVILVVVNLSPHHVHAGWIELDLDALGLKPDQPFQVHDLLTNSYYLWSGSRNYVMIDPQSAPAQIFAVRSRLRTEQDFDYYL
jgi:starch synthase (maltosyl-transferring)